MKEQNKVQRFKDLKSMNRTYEGVIKVSRMNDSVHISIKGLVEYIVFEVFEIKIIDGSIYQTTLPIYQTQKMLEILFEGMGVLK